MVPCLVLIRLFFPGTLLRKQKNPYSALHIIAINLHANSMLFRQNEWGVVAIVLLSHCQLECSSGADVHRYPLSKQWRLYETLNRKELKVKENRKQHLNLGAQLVYKRSISLTWRGCKEVAKGTSVLLDLIWIY